MIASLGVRDTLDAKPKSAEAIFEVAGKDVEPGFIEAGRLEGDEAFERLDHGVAERRQVVDERRQGHRRVSLVWFMGRG